jgi:hypothetical protein
MCKVVHALNRTTASQSRAAAFRLLNQTADLLLRACQDVNQCLAWRGNSRRRQAKVGSRPWRRCWSSKSNMAVFGDSRGDSHAWRLSWHCCWQHDLAWHQAPASGKDSELGGLKAQRAPGRADICFEKELENYR